MRICITGGTGFVGSWVAEYYAKQENENQVYVIDSLYKDIFINKGKMKYYIKDYLKDYDNITFIHRDVRSQERIEEIFKIIQPEAVIHAAGQVATTTSVLKPYLDFDINVKGTISILETIRKLNIDPSFIFCSTNKVYGDRVNEKELIEKETRYEYKDCEGINEGDIVDHTIHSPYGTSKLCADFYVQEYGYTYGLKTGVFRMSCLTGDTIIQTILGSKRIRDIKEGDIILSKNNNNMIYSKVSKCIKTNKENKKLYEIITRRGYKIKATGDHKFYTPKGFITLDLLGYGDLVCIYPQMEKLYDMKNEDEIILEKDIYNVLKELNLNERNIRKKIDKMKDNGLLPFTRKVKGYQRMIELVGYCFGDANLYRYKTKNRKNISQALQIYGKKKELDFIVNVLDSLNIPHSKEQVSYVTSILTNKRIIKGESRRIVITSAEYSSLFKLLGVPEGDKTLLDFNIPKWIRDGDIDTKRFFLRGLFGAELCRINYSKEKKSFGGLYFGQSREENKSKSLYSYLNTIKEILLKDFGIETSNIFNGTDYIRKNGTKTIQRNFKIYIEKENRKKFLGIGFGYHPNRNNDLFIFSEFDKGNEKDIKKFIDYYNKKLPKEMLWDSITSIREIQMENIYDITIEKTHNFIANGFLVHNCIYGPRQMGYEEQGWLVHFLLSALRNQPIKIYGNGKQVRDLLYITDLVHAYDKFIQKSNQIKNGVYNMGGGMDNSLSLLECIEILERILDRSIKYGFHNWRLADQKVYISDIRKASKELDWKPTISPENGIKRVVKYFLNFFNK